MREVSSSGDSGELGWENESYSFFFKQQFTIKYKKNTLQINFILELILLNPKTKAILDKILDKSFNILLQSTKSLLPDMFLHKYRENFSFWIMLYCMTNEVIEVMLDVVKE